MGVVSNLILFKNNVNLGIECPIYNPDEVMLWSPVLYWINGTLNLNSKVFSLKSQTNLGV